MALVMIVIRDVADRFHGFLSSVMLEVAPNVFVSPRMNPGVRTRVWDVMSDWYRHESRGSLVMVWRDLNAVGGVGLATNTDMAHAAVRDDLSMMFSGIQNLADEVEHFAAEVTSVNDQSALGFNRFTTVAESNAGSSTAANQCTAPQNGG